MTRLKPTFIHELELWGSGLKTICGVDEVGRGAFAGPVVTGAVVFPSNITFSNALLHEINDSKLLSPKKRQDLAGAIKNEALCYAVSKIDVPTINEIGIGKSAQKAFQEVIKKLSPSPDFCLSDAFFVDGINKTKQRALVKGDQISTTIAAASIIAKVYRDNLMEKLHETYRVYNFKQNKGYGTLFHREMLKTHGPSPVHRTSFRIGVPLKT